MLVHHVTKVADAAREMKKKCGVGALVKAAKETTVVSVPVEVKVSPQRLYAEDGHAASSSTQSLCWDRE